jgi:hypothetical protein
MVRGYLWFSSVNQGPLLSNTSNNIISKAITIKHPNKVTVVALVKGLTRYLIHGRILKISGNIINGWSDEDIA